jgi:hypothetical protein
MRGRLLVVAVVVLFAWVVPVVHTMPIDADGPSGLSDNGDFDDLIVSLASPTLAVTPPMLLVVVGVVLVFLAAVPLEPPCAVSQAESRSLGIRAPPSA